MQERYAELVIAIQLRLSEGDSLTINTNARTMSFARLVARKATEVTKLPVTIVETSMGKVLQTYPIDPVEKGVMRPQVRTSVLAHIVDLDEFPYDEDEDWNEPHHEVRTLAHYGHLSDPVFLDRRISIPWANIPYPGTAWAASMLGRPVSREEMWSLFGILMRLTSDWSPAYWAEQANVLSYREKLLNASSGRMISIKGSNTELIGEQSPLTGWISGVFRLPSGREYIPLLPVQSVHTAFKTGSVNGKIRSGAPFTLFGTPVTDAAFIIENGVVVSYDAREGKEALKKYFDVDAGTNAASGISLADSNTLECRYITRLVHPHYKKECRSILHLGGVLVDAIKAGTGEDDLFGLGQSIAHLEIPLAHDITVEMQKPDGSMKTIIAEGSFTV
ncbi:MAG: aminopeptidase [Spirochaetales bacterium]|nr:aminopeptidase [Spirochaetota bacterium]NLL24437.1 aminopeptidase [Spirochaetales bacterium]HOR80799.1 aminopeptidase [Sphaerochaeta sp.]HRV23805.1 aminopeptidase [Sphaerochaeta sp.]